MGNSNRKHKCTAEWEFAALLNQTVIQPTPSCCLSCATEHELIVLPNNVALVTFSKQKIAKVRPACWVTLTNWLLGQSQR